MRFYQIFKILGRAWPPVPPGPRPLEIQIPTESLVRIFTIADDQRQGNTTKTFFSNANTTYIASVLVLSTYICKCNFIPHKSITSSSLCENSILDTIKATFLHIYL